MTLFFDAEGYTSPTLDEQPTKSLLYVPINLGQLYGINSCHAYTFISYMILDHLTPLGNLNSNTCRKTSYSY